MLLKKYKNQLFEAIRNSNLDINNCILTRKELDDDIAKYEIQIKDTPFIFSIGLKRDSFHQFDFTFTTFAPGYPITERPDNWYDFNFILEVFIQWIHKHVLEYFLELSYPDFWENYRKTNNVIKFNDFSFEDKSAFSPYEQKQIKYAINDLKQLILNEFKLNKQEYANIDDKLNYLIDATQRLNKYDWKGLVISTIISITLGLSLDTLKGQILIELFRKVLGLIQGFLN